MPSPFPGMDPYLEERAWWRDIHTSLITYIREYLQPKVRPRYHVRIEERVYVEETRRMMVPDISIMKSRRVPRKGTGTAVAGAVYDPPLTLIVQPEPVTEVFLHIIDLTQGSRLVTVLEVLSPSNKTPGSEGYRLYRQKQSEVLQSSANLIEIDLLRDGEYILAPPRELVARDVGNWWYYLVSIYRAAEPNLFRVYPITLRKQLPRIMVPLAEDDQPVGVDLQAAFKRCYESGAYADLIDYHRDPPPPPLRVEDLEWLDTWLKKKRLR